MDCSHVGNGGHSGDRDTQMSEHEDNSTWSGRGSEEHDWSGQKKKNFDKKITARTEARILGTTEWATMTTRDSVE